MTTQLELSCSPPRYPAVPAARATDTSRAAARAIEPNAGTLRVRVFCVLQRWPSTADECADRIGETILAIRPRLSELRAMNKIADSGLRRRNASGKRAIVWKAL